MFRSLYSWSRGSIGIVATPQFRLLLFAHSMSHAGNGLPFLVEKCQRCTLIMTGYFRNKRRDPFRVSWTAKLPSLSWAMKPLLSSRVLLATHGNGFSGSKFSRNTACTDKSLSYGMWSVNNMSRDDRKSKGAICFIMHLFNAVLVKYVLSRLEHNAWFCCCNLKVGDRMVRFGTLSWYDKLCTKFVETRRCIILTWSVFTWIVFIFTDVSKILSWIVSELAWGFQSNTVYIKSAKIKFPLGITWWHRGILYISIGITLQSFIRYQSIALSTRCISVTNARVCFYQFLKCMTVFCQHWIIAWSKIDRAEMLNNGSWHIALDLTS